MTDSGPPVTIRRAAHQDRAALADIAARTFPLACPPQSTAADIALYISTRLTVDTLARELQSTGTVFYLAEAADTVVGYAMLVGQVAPPADLDARNPVELQRIYVDGAWHGRGVADHLMRTCLHHARTHGYDLIWLGTNEANERAIAFYRRHHFEIVGSKTFALGNSVETDHVMARPPEVTTRPPAPSDVSSAAREVSEAP